ncbi:Rpn family recombination-promoting nuclease/putative transposase [Leptolyngbya boryana CZ1]|uniref:Rpn family recombination-promoting nuclease/putative transposase n=1 Tax=Leptolyngbya boryana CZ1 TaxID=3060204 RepID=A0AA96WSH2_LEPBY|nr:Rpn family recombination-promoting nuclease/putative transposase [Leptolyngbya boryana]WNZ44792.1 Rpn family recombination-promoting nuclease/putative transposase [Leptolyngbya boryana CZ1]
MSFDNLCKLLAEKHPERFAAWLLGEEVTSTIEVLKTELSIEPIRADSVTFLKTSDRILHLEFQTIWTSDPPIPFRLLDYWVRLYRLYRSSITQIVIVLLPPSEGMTIENFFEEESTRHEFQVIKMWEQDPDPFLHDPVLLPFAALTRTQNPDQLLDRIVQQVAEIPETEERREVSSYVQLMAGLKYDKDRIHRLFREDMMRESVIYQEILQEGEERGLTQGLLQGQRSLILRMLEQKIGLPSQQERDRISTLNLEQLGNLAIALLNFSSQTDLEVWLAEQN